MLYTQCNRVGMIRKDRYRVENNGLFLLLLLKIFPLTFQLTVLSFRVLEIYISRKQMKNA
ncbi:protein FAR1-RELATED SEQUENCE 3-like [Gossypium australe]|uniref:Protein FAR1-RELATED SEQUENCE 3-like n=1 Tax=Gossypium australe TaxID=47621 RepID=A0A5B6VHW0_9ROSI|nr:protein FAR1-RELATED SEQUENCE 3-like [Gossypium australe]